jgi:hypothetical protein
MVNRQSSAVQQAPFAVIAEAACDPVDGGIMDAQYGLQLARRAAIVKVDNDQVAKP